MRRALGAAVPAKEDRNISKKAVDNISRIAYIDKALMKYPIADYGVSKNSSEIPS